MIKPIGAIHSQGRHLASYLNQYTYSHLFMCRIYSLQICLESEKSSPVGHSTGVPLGVDVNLADSKDLLSAAVNVEVVFSNNDTPRPGAVIWFVCLLMVRYNTIIQIHNIHLITFSVKANQMTLFRYVTVINELMKSVFMLLAFKTTEINHSLVFR